MSNTLIVSQPGMGAMYQLSQIMPSPKLTITLSHCTPDGKSGPTTFDLIEGYVKSQLQCGANFEEALDRANNLNIICDLTDQNLPWASEVQSELYDTFFDSDSLGIQVFNHEGFVETEGLKFTFVIHCVNETLEKALNRTIKYTPLMDVIKQCEVLSISQALTLK